MAIGLRAALILLVIALLVLIGMAMFLMYLLEHGYAYHQKHHVSR
jgi:hypothetical protein